MVWSSSEEDGDGRDNIHTQLANSRPSSTAKEHRDDVDQNFDPPTNSVNGNGGETKDVTETKLESSSDSDATPVISRKSAGKEGATKRKKYALTEEERKMAEEFGGFRRSHRDRQAPERLNIVEEGGRRKRGKRAEQSGSESGQRWDSEEDNDSSEGERKAKRKAPSRPTRAHNRTAAPARRRKKSSSGESEESEEESDESSSESEDSGDAPQVSRGGRISKKIDYKERASDCDVNSDDVLEWEEETANQSTSVHDSSQSDTIERVLRRRMGRRGATGPITTAYAIVEKGDPNEGGERGERQYQIKWVGWAYLHCTWETRESVKAMGAKGSGKLDNYLKEMHGLDTWLGTANREQRETYAEQRKKADDLIESYMHVGRVVAYREAAGGDHEYFCKWNGLPYSENTWEDAALMDKRAADKVRRYHYRVKNRRRPNAGRSGKRAQVDQLEEQPEYIGRPPQMDTASGGNEGEEETEGKLTLRDYQLTGVNWITHCWSKRSSCILADDMGLGKTIQVLSFLNRIYHEFGITGVHLVIVPLSTIPGWEQEAELWASELNTVTYIGDANSRDVIRTYELSRQSAAQVNIILTTYEILLKDKAYFRRAYPWAVMVVDEAHRLKNDESMLYKELFTFDTDLRLLMTGTPLQNNLKEFWALLHFCAPEKFGSWDYFQQEHVDSEIGTLRHGNEVVKPYLLRRMKKDVEKSLPPKIEQLLRVDMTKQQKKYYKYTLSRNYEALMNGVKNSIGSFINLTMELKKCANHAHLTRAPDVIAVDRKDRLQELMKGSGKLILLDKLLTKLRAEHRVLVFSQFVIMLDLIEEYLRLKEFAFQRLDGSTSSQDRRVALEHFNAPNSRDFVFLLSTRAGGIGINLATADTVVIFDSDWNPHNDLQAQSRAHRIGQTRQVNIYRLVTKHSVDESILERAKQKRVLDHLVIERIDTSGRTVLGKAGTALPSDEAFSKEELNNIIKFGASELFAEKDDGVDEVEVDLDDILQRAETRDDSQTEQPSAFNALLSSFKVAEFTFDEEMASWEAIIPAGERKAASEEAALEAALKPCEFDEFEIELGAVRKRRAPEQYVAGEDNSAKRCKRTTATSNGESGTLFGFKPGHVKKFVRSFSRHACPLAHLDDIGADADLCESSQEQLRSLATELIDACVTALMNEAATPQMIIDNDDHASLLARRVGPLIMFGGCEVRVRQTMKTAAMFAPVLRRMHNCTDQRRLFQGAWLPSNVREQKGWDVKWRVEDDAALLMGVIEHGQGRWREIKMDSSIPLAEKILPALKSEKPQTKQLQARLEYLARLVSEQEGSPATRPMAPDDSTISEPMARAKKQMDFIVEYIRADAPKEPKEDTENHDGREHMKKKEKKEKKKKVKVTKKKKENKGSKRDVCEKEGREEWMASAHEFALTDAYALTCKFKINDKKNSSLLADASTADFQACVSDLAVVKPNFKHVMRSMSSSTSSTAAELVGECPGDLLAVGVTIIRRTMKCADDVESRKRKFSLLWGFVAKYTVPSAGCLLDLFHQLVEHPQRFAGNKNDVQPSQPSTSKHGHGTTTITGKSNERESSSVHTSASTTQRPGVKSDDRVSTIRRDDRGTQHRSPLDRGTQHRSPLDRGTQHRSPLDRPRGQRRDDGDRGGYGPRTTYDHRDSSNHRSTTSQRGYSDARFDRRSTKAEYNDRVPPSRPAPAPPRAAPPPPQQSDDRSEPRDRQRNGGEPRERKSRWSQPSPSLTPGNATSTPNVAHRPHPPHDRPTPKPWPSVPPSASLMPTNAPLFPLGMPNLQQRPPPM